MRNQIGLIVLIVVCLGLGVGLVMVKKQANDRNKNDTVTIITLSNKWVKTSDDLSEQKQFAAVLLALYQADAQRLCVDILFSVKVQI